MVESSLRRQLIRSRVAVVRMRRDLPLSWSAIRAASVYVQQLDDLVVRYDAWGDAYANAQAVLESATSRIDSWADAPVPEVVIEFGDLRHHLFLLLRAAQRSVRHFEWGEAQGYLFQAGELIYGIANLLEVQL